MTLTSIAPHPDPAPLQGLDKHPDWAPLHGLLSVGHGWTVRFWEEARLPGGVNQDTTLVVNRGWRNYGWGVSRADAASGGG